MPYQVSMMGWVGSGEDFCGLGWVQKFWVGLGFEKVTHDQLWSAAGPKNFGSALLQPMVWYGILEFNVPANTQHLRLL